MVIPLKKEQKILSQSALSILMTKLVLSSTNGNKKLAKKKSNYQYNLFLSTKNLCLHTATEMVR
ncbi:Uncharacterised protein [Streptococcus equi subsp. zooepidemicus]|nr:hypothetical protein AT53_01424 [Streptococcus equi subsp. zooepidemicus Sz5]VTS38068.1 Uncharacterised protein [Streptococcus equi subsp. zooepidemicus]